MVSFNTSELNGQNGRQKSLSGWAAANGDGVRFKSVCEIDNQLSSIF